MGGESSQIALIFILSAAFVVFLAILLILFLVIYQKRIVTQENRLQKLQNERQQVLLKATIEGQERERQRLAKDLHDGIGSLLSALSLHLKYHKSKEPPHFENSISLNEICKMVDEGIENVRSVSHNLLPATLERFGLVTAMKECIAPINKTSDLNINIKVINESRQISKDIELGLLRVFQELVQNTIKHSNASEANIILEYTTDWIKFQYIDNGQGLKWDNDDMSGIGTKNMQSRIQVLNGKFNINKQLKAGFEVNIEVPIESKF